MVSTSSAKQTVPADAAPAAVRPLPARTPVVQAVEPVGVEVLGHAGPRTGNTGPVVATSRVRSIVSGRAFDLNIPSQLRVLPRAVPV